MGHAHLWRRNHILKPLSFRIALAVRNLLVHANSRFLVVSLRSTPRNDKYWG